MKKKVIIGLIAVFLILGAIGAWMVYSKIFRNGVDLKGKKEIVVFLPSGGNYQNLLDTLSKYDILTDFSTFRRVAGYKDLDKKYKPGRYLITQGMSNNALVNMFLSGRQQPLNIAFNSVRVREDLAKKTGSKLECGEKKLLDILNDETVAKKYGFTKDNFMVMFIPNTYQILWTITPAEFVERMYSEWKKFWNDDRLKKAEAIGLTPVEVSVLASIVCGETNKTDEMDEIAGLYINRLKKGWKLEADPTVKYAVGDFTLTRILKKHLETESPYNTYLHEGLPPGPINLPDIVAIDKVLNYAHHNYMFMCAKEDLSGYHNFAVTNAEHEANALKYKQAYRIWEKKKKEKEGVK